MAMQVSQNRVHALDSLRGLAAVYVVFFHLLLVPKHHPVITNTVFSHVVMFGGTGVFLFFVISGFSLSMTMPRHESTTRPWLSYCVSRLFRIAPVYFIMLLLSVLRDCIASHTPTLESLALNLTFLFNLVPGQQEGIVWASWTIGVEMLFYILFPLIYRGGLRIQIISSFTGLAIFTALYNYSPHYLYWSLLGYFPMFMLGMLTFQGFLWLRDKPLHGRSGSVLIGFGLGVLLICMTISGAEKNVYLREPIAVGYALVLVGCVLRRPIILESRILMFFGRISYTLYLVHPPVVYGLSAVFLIISSNTPISMSYLLCVAVAFAVTIPFAYALHLWVERPGIKIGRDVLLAADLRPATKRAGLI